MSPRTVIAGACLALGACLAVPADGEAQNPPSTSFVTLGKPYLAKVGDGHALVHGVSTKQSRDPAWVLVEVEAQDGTLRCEFLKRLGPRQTLRFVCPLDGAAAGQRYASRVRLFSDGRLENRDLLYEPEFEVTDAGLASATEPSAEGVTVLTQGLDEADPPPALPVTLKPTWYRRMEKGFSMRAYEHSGDLTVDERELSFTDGKNHVRLPRERIMSVRWEPMPGDIANHWVVVRFTDEDGKPAAVGFRDGGRMGTRKGTGPMYLVVRRAMAGLTGGAP